MATATKTAACLADANVRTKTGFASQGNGADQHLIIGKHDKDWLYRAFAKFDQNLSFWSGVYQIVRAEIKFKTTGEVHVSFGDAPKVRAQRLTGAFVEGNAGEGVWEASEYQNPSYSTYLQASVTPNKQQNYEFRIDVTGLVEQMAPKSVRKRDGAPGGALTNYGFRLVADSESEPKHLIEVYSKQATTGTDRPVLELTYEQGPLKPNAPTLGAPQGTIANAPAAFTGAFTDSNENDRLQQVEIEVYLGSGGVKVWSGTFDAAPSEQAAGQFSVPYPGSLRSQTAYEWRARVSDGTFWSDWSHATRPYRTWTVTNSAPSATVVPLSDRATLAGTKFEATFSDPDNDSLHGYQVQLRTQTVAGSPLWDGNDNLWDSGVISPTATEVASGRFAIGYGGGELSGSTTYSWRARVLDKRGAWSAWSYDEFLLTADYEPEYSLISFLTRVGDRRPPARVVFRAVTLTNWQVVTVADAGTWTLTYDGATSASLSYNATDAAVKAAVEGLVSNSLASVTLTVAGNTRTYDIVIVRSSRVGELTASESLSLDGNAGNGTLSLTSTSSRGPGPVVATIEDPNGLGASQYMNSPGEFHMTLPALHPQISAIVPWLTHYSVQIWWGDRYRSVFDGLVTDIDATEDDAVIYGMDYLGLLDLTVDERYNPSKPDLPHTQGGSKYVDQQISDIVWDLLSTSKGTNSPVKFISLPAKDSVQFDVFSEHVTVYSTYAQRLSFIAGLLDSHKQGTGNRSRLWVERSYTNPYIDSYRWRLSDNVGQTRDNLRFEYGGLVQNFRVVMFGDFGTMAAGIGRTKEGTKVMYRSAAAPGMSQNLWGRVVKPMLYTDLSDAADLERRTAQVAASYGRVGKRLALGIRVDALQPLDGYDIGDSIPVDIVRGVIDTNRYGDGYWTIHGIEWNMAADGSTDLTLSILPREDGSKPDAELIPFSDPLASREWSVGYGAPSDDLESPFYYDENGSIWVRNSEGRWVLYGSDASLITEGNLPGGSNLIPDGSFEMAPWPTSAPITATWNVAADFNDTTATDGQSATYSGMAVSSDSLVLSPAP